MDNSQHTAELDTTVELPYEEVLSAKRALEARVDNPGVGTPSPGRGPAGPEIENPTETESDPQKSDTGPSSSGAGRWN
ncbi:MAG TPA: hypothetical protein VFL14_02220 [Xanthomonadales bacterium]|nr:hypothetical protein [Xanthomonadales bacterium]